MLTVIHGIISLRFPEISLNFLDNEKLIDDCYAWPDIMLPHRAQAKFSTEEDEDVSNFQAAAIQISKSLNDIIAEHQSLEEGKQYVLESSLLPFFGTIEYLLLYDRKKRQFLPIPQEILGAKDTELKLPDDRDHNVDWLVVEYFDSFRHLLFRNESTSMSSSDLCTKTLEQVGFTVLAKVNATKYFKFQGPLSELFSFQDAAMRRAVSDRIASSITS